MNNLHYHFWLGPLHSLKLHSRFRIVRYFARLGSKNQLKITGVPRHEVFHRGSLSFETVIDHDSALIRVFAQESYGSFHDGIDVFITYFLRSIEGAKDLDFGSKRRDLQEAIDWEERSKQRTNDDDQDA